ncbi:MAG: hypothetical protein ACRDK9_02255 [Solirubrobacterales bacterium]
MESSATPTGIDLEAQPTRPLLALVLALISIPGSTVTWDALPGGGFVFGLPFAIAAIVLGVQARRRSTTEGGKALAAIVIGAAIVTMMAVWTVVESL